MATPVEENVNDAQSEKKSKKTKNQGTFVKSPTVNTFSHLMRAAD